MVCFAVCNASLCLNFVFEINAKEDTPINFIVKYICVFFRYFLCYILLAMFLEITYFLRAEIKKKNEVTFLK